MESSFVKFRIFIRQNIEEMSPRPSNEAKIMVVIINACFSL